MRREIAKATEEAKRKAAEEKKNSVAVIAPATTPATTGTTSVKTVAKKTRSYLNLNASDVALNNKFELNRGKLPWPVDNGFVSVHFGPYTIEGTKLRDNNPGVTIATPNVGGAVKAILTEK
ncbi:MAG: hypothetical protein WDO71_11840 [Bacteroidota bacterium]